MRKAGPDRQDLDPRHGTADWASKVAFAVFAESQLAQSYVAIDSKFDTDHPSLEVA